MNLSTPWLIAECNDQDTIRQVLCDGPGDVWKLIDDAPMGELIGLILVLPPSQSDSGEWEFERVHAVKRDPAWKASAAFSIVLVTASGSNYAGPPLQRLEKIPADAPILRELRKQADGS